MFVIRVEDDGIRIESEESDSEDEDDAVDDSGGQSNNNGASNSNNNSQSADAKVTTNEDDDMQGPASLSVDPRLIAKVFDVKAAKSKRVEDQKESIYEKTKPYIYTYHSN